MVSNCEFVTFPLVSWVRCGTLLYQFLIFAPLLTQSDFSHMKVIKHIRWDFHSVNWIMSKVLGLGGAAVSKIKFSEQ